jgi:hypothetical protein
VYVCVYSLPLIIAHPRRPRKIDYQVSQCEPGDHEAHDGGGGGGGEKPGVQWIE